MKSLKELYKIGRGPSSSHTIGPEKACNILKEKYAKADLFKIELCGSLSATGKGHLTDKIIEETLAPTKVEIIFNNKKSNLPHPNTFYSTAYSNGEVLGEDFVCSVGGGAITFNGETLKESKDVYPHSSFTEIKEFCTQNNLRLWQYVEVFEDADLWDYLADIWDKMKACIKEGLNADGVLAGGIDTVRKAKTLYDQYALNESEESIENRLVCAYAFAVSETNASGGRVVTAPTCGSCGVLPAVLKYLQKKFNLSDNEICKSLATASVIGNIVKTNASISGAECGCQAEVGVACAMASAAIAEIKGFSIEQIEYAAEIAIEHHLGLTCDPVCGLVQIPCIERNAVAALRALNEVSLATFLANTSKVSFDTVVKTMYETGKDLHVRYRETSKGGLAKTFKI
ncbi:MAG: L-serine ammonia-lyase [Clostridiales bacterium]|nr:L-serine ammonia-lyase [Clostridiales bacterium]